MDKKQGFFSALREEVIRTLSPARSRSASPGRSGCTRKKKHHVEGCATDPEQLIWTSESLRPVMEGPDPDEQGVEYPARRRASSSGLGSWVKGQLYSSGGGSSGSSKADLRLLLGVMGTPLAPVHVSSLDPLPHLCIKDTPIETLSAQYILQQYTAAAGGQKLQNSIRNAYALGKLKMTTSEFETATKVIKNRNSPETGSFLLWQMNPDMWYIELSIAESKVHAGCNGKLVWRHTPWLSAHTAKGPVRPLRRALQGLNPRATASLFADAKFVGERKLNGEDCFILKLCADPHTLKARSEGPAEIIRHVLFGFFSQKTALLVYLEDSHLARIQSSGGDAVYWETTINSFLSDYRPVEGVMIAHSGHSLVTLFRFGEMAMSHTKTRMEESWTIEEVAFNIPGLSEECFIPPDDLKSGSISEARELSQEERTKNSSVSALRVKVATLEKSHELQLNK